MFIYSIHMCNDIYILSISKHYPCCCHLSSVLCPSLLRFYLLNPYLLPAAEPIPSLISLSRFPTSFNSWKGIITMFWSTNGQKSALVLRISPACISFFVIFWSAEMAELFELHAPLNLANIGFCSSCQFRSDCRAMETNADTSLCQYQLLLNKSHTFGVVQCEQLLPNAADSTHK